MCCAVPNSTRGRERQTVRASSVMVHYAFLVHTSFSGHADLQRAQDGCVGVSVQNGWVISNRGGHPAQRGMIPPEMFANRMPGWGPTDLFGSGSTHY